MIELMAILNVTPDSFYAGGRSPDADDAVRCGIDAISAGAAILDVGGESTRPRAESVPIDEQLRRVLPVITRLAVHRSTEPSPTARISIDTTRAAVAQAALKAGAAMINDVSGGLDDPAILDVAAAHRAEIVLMHRRHRPADDRYSHEYEERARPDVSRILAEVEAFLAGRVEAAIKAGVPHESIVIDPGLGFGKSVDENVALLRGIDSLRAVHPRVLIGASRKSFIGAVGGASDPADRLPGSLAVAIAASRAGAAILRVHDVAATRQALAVAARLETPERR